MTEIPHPDELTRLAEIMLSLPELMKARRTELGIGTPTAARQAGLSQQVFWRIETTNTKDPLCRNMIKILRWLGATVPEVECMCLFVGPEHEPRCPNRGALINA